MPIQIPTVINPSVRTERAPDQRQDASGATPDAFGASIGRSLQQAGAQIGNAGDFAAEEARRQKELGDAGRVLDAQNKLQDQLRDHLYGPNGEMNRQGVNIDGATARTADFYKKVTDDLSSQFTDPKQRLTFNKIVSASRDSTLDMAARREGQAKIQATVEIAKTTLDTTKQAAIDSANDDNVAEAQMKIGMGAIAANPTGQPKEVLDAAIQSYRSDVQTARIQRMAVDNLSGAEQMYGKLKGQIVGQDHVKIEKLLEPLRARREGVAVASEYVGRPGPRVQQLAVAATTGAPIVPVVGGVSVPRLATAVEGKESGGDPNAVSPKGAAGRMQVMPDTARDISKRLGDGLIGADMTDAQVREVMKDPTVGARYGVTYLHDQLQRYGGDIQAALVAYNAGPGVADKWLRERKSANDLSSLPAETRDYVPKVMSRYADLQGGDASTVGGQPTVLNQVRMGALPPPGQKMTEQNWSLKFYKPQDMLAPTEGGRQVDARAAVMADQLGQQFYDATGIRVPINDVNDSPGTSGKRRGASDPNDNPHVGNSQHLHGKAFDFQIQKLTPDQKRQFLQIARNVGFSGVGFYEGKSGHLHLDTGNARTWGGLPQWAGASLPALGQTDMAVAGSIGGLPVPPSMQAAAGGGATGAPRVLASAPTTASNVRSFLPPALSPDARDLIGAPVPVPSAAPGAPGGPSAPSPVNLPPAVRNAIDLASDFDPAGIRDAVASDPRLDSPVKLAAAKATAERAIRAAEADQRNALKTLRAASIQHIQRGGSSDDLDPDLMSALLEKDPKFATDTLPAMEDRIRKRKDTTDEGEYYRLTNMPDEQFVDYDLSSSAHKLSRGDFQKFADQQKAARKSTAADALKWDGLQTQKGMADMALKGAGIFPDKDDATANARAGAFYLKLDLAKRAFEEQNKRTMKPAEMQAEIDRLMTPVNQADWTGGKQYLFEQGTPAANAARRRNELPSIGYPGQTFSAARKLEDIPTDALQTIVDNHSAVRGTPPKPAEAMQIFNDALALSTGRNPPAPTAARGEIIGALRRQFGASIQTDPARRDELEAKIQDVYNRTLRRLTTQQQAAPPPVAPPPY